MTSWSMRSTCSWSRVYEGVPAGVPAQPKAADSRRERLLPGGPLNCSPAADRRYENDAVLVVEVFSPSNTRDELDDKVEHYLGLASYASTSRSIPSPARSRSTSATTSAGGAAWRLVELTSRWRASPSTSPRPSPMSRGRRRPESAGRARSFHSRSQRSEFGGGTVARGVVDAFADWARGRPGSSRTSWRRWSTSRPTTWRPPADAVAVR